MALVNIINVSVHDNPTAFTNPFTFEITFECIQPLKEDLEWKVIYVGSPEDSQYDQTLEEVLVGPVAVGINKFVLQAPAPDYIKIKNEDLLGVTVTLVTCSYVEQEFVRVGYYVNNDYNEPYDPLTPPNPVEISKLFRNILADEPRVTRFAIDWSGNSPTVPIEGGPEEDIVVNENEDVMDFDKMEEIEDGNEDEDDDDDDDGGGDEEDANVEVDLDEDEDADEDEDGGEEEEENGDDEDNEESDGDNEEDNGGNEEEEDGTMENIAPYQASSTLPLNEDSMDVAMMQQYQDGGNLSHQGIF